MQIVGVKFKQSNEIFYFNASNLKIKKGDAVVCENDDSLCYGIAETDLEEKDTSGEIKKVVRIATDGDKKKFLDLKDKEVKAVQKAKELVKKHNLEMKMIDAEYTFDMSKLTFSFTADNRVDFRDLLKSLASEFKTRIELRQVGARDESKILGGYGPCGRPLCCANHLKEFEKVSIKMAKDQGLSLNPSGINGMCSRLKCCLSYEENDYLQALQRMPKLNSKVKTPDGEGSVTFNNVLTNEVSVKFANPEGGYTIKDYALGEIVFEKREQPANNKTENSNKNENNNAQNDGKNLKETSK